LIDPSTRLLQRIGTWWIKRKRPTDSRDAGALCGVVAVAAVAAAEAGDLVDATTRIGSRPYVFSFDALSGVVAAIKIEVGAAALGVGVGVAPTKARNLKMLGALLEPRWLNLRQVYAASCFLCSSARWRRKRLNPEINRSSLW
jgi:hypothetical protein